MMKIEEGCQRSCILEDLKAGSYVTSPKYLEYHKSSCYTESGLCHEKKCMHIAHKGMHIAHQNIQVNLGKRYKVHVKSQGEGFSKTTAA